MIKEEVDITDPSNFQFTSSLAKRWFVEHDNMFTEGYPFAELVNSIKKNGFIPNFPDTSYHGEICGHLPSAILLSKKNGKYSIPGGIHRLAAARAAGLKKVECYVKVDDCQEPYERNISEFNLPISIFTGRTVLDITGFFTIQAGLYGAEVKGVCECESYDIVFCNRASIDNVLDRIARITERCLLIWMGEDSKELSTQLMKDLKEKGFTRIDITPKKHVVAIKQYRNVIR